MKKIGFYCEHAFGLYSILPIYQKYVNNSNDVYVITYRRYEELIIREFQISKHKIIFIEDHKSIIGSKFTHWFQIFGVNENFSEFYSQRLKIRFGNFKSKISRSIKFLKVDNKNVNFKYSRLLRLLYAVKLIKIIPHDFQQLFVVSKVFHPYLIQPFEKNIFLIMESWDHPGKEPLLVNPRIAFGWNKPLNRELKFFQNFQNVRRICPLKFRYILELEKLNEEFLYNKLDVKYKKDLQKIDSSKTVVYPICTSSNYFAFKGEVEFVKDLAQLLKKSSKKLYVRPYPLAPLKDREILSKIPNVDIGEGNDFKNGIEVFDLNHQIHKYLLIKKAYAVFNVGTTFLFDAALLNDKKIIVQFILNDRKYGDFNRYSKGVHIKKYLHNEMAVHFEELISSSNMHDYLNFKYRDKINEWLLN